VDQEPGDLIRAAGPDDLILAVESATRAVGVALLRGETLLDEETSRDERPPSERLLPAIDALLRRNGIALDALAGFAVSVGPGSFTGLRVGIATVKGLAFGSGLPVAAVSTLAALALPALDGGAPVAALLDARRGELYAAVFAADGSVLLPDCVRAPGALAGLLPAGTRIVAGEGAGPGAGDLAERLPRRIEILPPPHGVARARDVGVLGVRLLGRAEGVPAGQVAPRYVRRAEAEARRTGERFER
jgi:tRNA threonylcarbamoyladenosine biosynthesis protein TsaB